MGKHTLKLGLDRDNEKTSAVEVIRIGKRKKDIKKVDELTEEESIIHLKDIEAKPVKKKKSAKKKKSDETMHFVPSHYEIAEIGISDIENPTENFMKGLELYKEKKRKEALKIWSQLDENPDTQFAIAYWYHMKKEHTLAARFYKKLAEQGNSYAQLILGLFYFTGDGVPESLMHAYMWVSIAKTNENKKAREIMSLIRIPERIRYIAQGKAVELMDKNEKLYQKIAVNLLT